MKNKQKFHLECRGEISVYFLLVGMLLIILWICANCSADNLLVFRLCNGLWYVNACSITYNNSNCDRILCIAEKLCGRYYWSGEITRNSKIELKRSSHNIL